MKAYVSSKSVRPKICIITLPDCTERQRACRDQLLLLSNELDWEFIDAHDGRGSTTYPASYNPNKALKIVGHLLTMTEVACFMSHRRAWQIAEKENRCVLVMEDDFVLEPHFVESIDLAMLSYTDWDIFRLQGLADVPYDVVFQQNDLRVVRHLSDPTGGTAYIVKPKCAKELCLWSESIYEPVDIYLEHLRYHKQKILSIIPYSVSIQNVQSTIGDRDRNISVRGKKKLKRSFHRLLFRMSLYMKRRTW